MSGKILVDTNIWVYAHLENPVLNTFSTGQVIENVKIIIPFL